VEALEKGFNLLNRPALDRLGHHRGGGNRDRAALAQELGVLHPAVLNLEVDVHLVAAERVVSVGFGIALLGHSEVARLAVMVQDQLLVQFAQLAHPKISFTLAIAAAKASTSLSVL
jgi:hypothetical protein